MRTKLAAILLAVGCLYAQGDRGTITGTVADPAGAVIANAAIEVRNSETGAVYPTATTATGNYTIAQVPTGTYEMSVTAPGFKKYVRQNIVVEVAQVVRLDVGLEVGATTESITVSGEVSLLKTESGELSHEIQAQHLVDLGLLGIGGTFSSSQGMRFYQAEVALIPGASVPAGGFILGVRVNGAPNGTQRTQIEGMDGTNQINSVQAGTGASVDAIQETAIQTSNYAPEFGSVGGGLFNIAMRSGTNQYHGAGYDYLSNEAFDGATPFVNTLQRIRRNDYGFNGGGPVRIPKVYNGKDKTFFFYNREQYRESFVTNNQAVTVPTAAYREGNFAGAITGGVVGTDPLGNSIRAGMIYDPLSVQNVNGQLVRTQFPNNFIPPERRDKVALAIQNLIPNPTNGNNALNYLPSFPNDRVTTNQSVKIDHQLDAKAKISGLYLTNSSNSQYSQSLNGSEGLPATITATRGTFSKSNQFRLNFDDTLTPTLLLHVGAGILLYQLNDHSPTTGFNDSAIGLTGVPNVGGRFPTIGGLCVSGTGVNTSACTGTGGMMNMGPGVAVPGAVPASAASTQSITKQMTPTYQASLTWIKNNHSYKFGSEVREFGYPLLSLASTNGTFNFAASQTAQPYAQSSTIGGQTVGFPYASFLLGLVNSGTVNPPADLRTGKHFIALFAQDSWKITRKLTFTYGLRYDYDTYPKEEYGRLPTLAPTLANPTVGGHPGAAIYEATCHCSFGKNYPYAFGPRLGVAYQITPKTVFHAGAGIAYDGTATAATGTASASPANNFTAPGFGDPAMTLSAGVPKNYLLPWPNLSAGSYPNPNFPNFLNGMTSVVDQNAGRPARQMQWSAGFQREILEDLALDVAYVGNRGAWWLSSILDNYNALTPQILTAAGLNINNAADRAILRAPIGSTAAGRFQNMLPYAGFPLTATVAQSLRPFPQFSSGLTPLWAPEGRTWYDSLQLKVTKRYSHGLILDYALTFAKEEQLGTEGGTVNDYQNRLQNKSISGYSRPFTSVVSASYRLPSWGPNKYFSQVVRDWMIGSVLSYGSGLPVLAPTSSNNLSTLLFRSTFFNRNPGVPLFLKDLNCHCIDPTQQLVLNPAAWSNPTDGQWGTSAPYYNDYRYERRPAESMSFGRIFRFHESIALTVRMNFQNIFNRTQLQNPTATNPLAPTTHAGNGQLTGGFGFVNYLSGDFTSPRQGTLEMRFQF